MKENKPTNIKKGKRKLWLWISLGLFCTTAIIIPTTLCVGTLSSSVENYLNKHSFPNVTNDDIDHCPTKQMFLNTLIYVMTMNAPVATRDQMKVTYNFANYKLLMRFTVSSVEYKINFFYLTNTIKVGAHVGQESSSAKYDIKKAKIVWNDDFKISYILQGDRPSYYSIPTYENGKIVWLEPNTL